MDSLQSIIDAFIGYLLGPLGKSFFTLSLVGCGIACGMGKLHWKWVVTSLVGAGISFGAPYLINMFVK